MAFLTKFFTLVILALLLPTMVWANYYRYYDASGRPTIATSVTSNHVRYGYEVLNDQMYVIKRVPPSTQVTQQQIQQKRQQQEELKRLRAAYGSSHSATRKRDELLRKLNEQLNFHNSQYQKLLQENKNLISQQNSYIRQKKAVPAPLAQQVAQSNRAVQSTAYQIRNLQQQITQTTQMFNQAIQQLKANGL